MYDHTVTAQYAMQSALDAFNAARDMHATLARAFSQRLTDLHQTEGRAALEGVVLGEGAATTDLLSAAYDALGVQDPLVPQVREAPKVTRGPNKNKKAAGGKGKGKAKA